MGKIKRKKSKSTNFQKRVYQIVSKIPKGKVMSYKEVAELSGYPRAWRAVGNILNKNRDPKIPCHRVIRSDGGIGGFAKGKEEKIKLLKKEGAILQLARAPLVKTKNVVK